MKISVALCTYNGERFLGEQLASIASQTRLPDELIVFDDVSTDATSEIVSGFAANAPFPVHFTTNDQNLGSTKNFERAIAKASGEIIFLCDQDDVWYSNKIERVCDEFEKDPELGMVFSDAELVGPNLEGLGRNLCDFTYQKADRSGDLFSVLIRKNVVTGAALAFRSRFIPAFFPIPTDIPNTIHDAWIALVIAAISKAKFIEEPLVKYRQHEGQQIGIDWNFGQRRRGESYDRSISFHVKEIGRLEMLRDRFRDFTPFKDRDLDALIEQAIREKRELISHYEARAALPDNYVLRLPGVFKEFWNGNYSRFSRGIASAAKDLFEVRN